MSLIGSLNAAVGGMNAQAAALSSISDNVANSQTVGFKETDTSFSDYVTQSSAAVHAPGAVLARPEYTNSVQGTVTQVSNPTSVAISGSGFFPVQRLTGTSGVNPLQYYSRVGDFSPNNDGNLINSAGYALDGWPATAGATMDTSKLTPIQISQAPSDPVATSTITLAANLPAVPPAGGAPYSSTVQVNDAAGNAQSVVMNWTQVNPSAAVPPAPISALNPATPNQWNLTITAGVTAGTPPTPTVNGPYLVTFGNGTVGQPAGTIASIGPAAGAIGTAATIAMNPDFGYGAQPITLNLGTFGSTGGVTQFTGTDYAVASQTQNGQAQGNYSSVSIQTSGDVVINYDNGTNKTIARIPLATFNSPDSLQQQDGQAFTATIGSGSANVLAAGSGGAGTLVAGAEEGSNVDIAAQFTQMIVAQRAYTANSKVVTTANSMMQDALNMIQG
jgi:flagellar hook protein FlgE